jgi:hypothetical protein
MNCKKPSLLRKDLERKVFAAPSLVAHLPARQFSDTPPASTPASSFCRQSKAEYVSSKTVFIMVGSGAVVDRLKTKRQTCSKCPIRGILGPMSADEVLEQVKALAPRERRKFFDCVHQLETTIEVEPALPSRGELARALMGAGRRWLKPGADPVGDLIREREEDEKLDQADERQ